MAVPSAPRPDAPNGDESLADGGQAFARELLRHTKLEDFDDPSVYLDALETLPDEFEGVEPAGFRDELRKLLEALRRRLRLAPKTPTGPPQPPAGAPLLPTAVTGRLDHIKDPPVRNAANRLLDGSVVKGWTPKVAASPEPAEIAKQGGRREAMKDFGQFVGRSGGTKGDIKRLRHGNGYQFTSPDKQTTIVIRQTQESGKVTNELRIWLPDPAPGLPRQGRAAKLQIKIRYE